MTVWTMGMTKNVTSVRDRLAIKKTKQVLHATLDSGTELLRPSVRLEHPTRARACRSDDFGKPLVGCLSQPMQLQLGNGPANAVDPRGPRGSQQVDIPAPEIHRPRGPR